MASLRDLSFRSKLLALLIGLALLMGTGSSIYSFARTNLLLREEVAKRGRYFAQNLALNSYFGILTEDKPILSRPDGERPLGGRGEEDGPGPGSAPSAAEDGESDILGAMIRDAKGQILVQTGQAIRPQDLPQETVREIEQLDLVTARGEEVILFRAPVLAPASASGGDMAAELGVGAASAAGGGETKGGVEIIISKRQLAIRQRGILIESIRVAPALVGSGSALCWFLTGVR